MTDAARTAVASGAAAPVSQRMTLGIALPIMLSNVSTPRLEAIDTAVVGQISDPGCIARTVTLLRYYLAPLRSVPRRTWKRHRG